MASAPPLPPPEDQSGRREIDFEPSHFVLYELPTGEYEIQVVSNNSAAYFFISHSLTDNEVTRYRARGKKYLLKLADQVRRKNG